MNRFLPAILLLFLSTTVWGEDLKTKIVVSQGSPVTITTEIMEPTSLSNVELRIDQFKQAHPSETIVVSSDIPEVLLNHSQGEKVFPLPVGEISNEWKKSKVVSTIKNYGSKIATNIRQDKIGFMIVTFNTVYDSYIWIHASHLSTFERTGNILFTVMTSVVFGLNKDSWAKTTQPFYNFFKKMAGLGPSELSRNQVEDIALRFFSSLALSTALNMARIPFLSFNQLVDHTLLLNGWTYPIFLSVISTMASFAWSEQIALIDQDKYPSSKFVFRRVMEFRSILLGTFAATAKLMNPSMYGLGPWLTLISSGALGLYIYSDTDRWVRFIENNDILERWLKPWLTTPKVTCSGVFGG